MIDFTTLITQFNGWAMQYVETYGYFGVFFICLIGNASLIFPAPTFLIIMASATVLNPWLLGIAGGTGAAIGELTGYYIGRGGKHVIQKKYEAMLIKAKKWIEKHGIFPVLVVFAATPLPSDIVGVLSGTIAYDVRKFFLATLIGKLIAYTGLALVGCYGSSILIGSVKMFWGMT